MKTIATVIALVVGLASLAGAAEPESVVLAVTWDMTVEAGGRVTAINTRDERIVALHERLETRFASGPSGRARSTGGRSKRART